ncbi:MAG: hypothetical protein LC785_17670 [Acidobacteria bacterium]|nr:hypothetical protein [Acidobacteriota bacterium]
MITYRGTEIYALILAAAFAGVSCRAGADSGAGANTSTTQQQPTTQQQQQAAQPKRLSADDLKKLRWIEGAWRTTLAVEGFKDQTLSKVDDVTRFELKDSVFGNGGDDSRWAATALDDDSVTFSPVAKARNTFRWQRESADVWKATLDYPANGDKPASQRVYRMERLPQPKHLRTAGGNL